MIFARLKLWSITLGLFIAALAASYFGGKRAAKADAKAEELEDYVETRERMDAIGRMSDADAARDWLRDRGQR